MTDDHRIYHASVTVTYGVFVSAANEKAAKIRALDIDFKDMRMSDDVSVDVELWVEGFEFEVADMLLNRKTAASESLGDTLTAVDPTQPTSTTREEVL